MLTRNKLNPNKPFVHYKHKAQIRINELTNKTVKQLMKERDEEIERLKSKLKLKEGAECPKNTTIGLNSILKEP
jgi:hypothetical protein